jgi:hypothetical protein
MKGKSTLDASVHTHFEAMMNQLQQTYSAMVQDLEERRLKHREEVEAAWKEIEAARRGEHQAKLREQGAASPSAARTAGIMSTPMSREYSREVRTPNFGSQSQKGSPKAASIDHKKLFSAPEISFSFWITVWPGFHRNGVPVRVLVHRSFKSLDHVIQHAAAECYCRPSPTILYTPDGKTVSSLEQLIPSGNYLIFPSGSLYREECVPTALLEALAYAVQGSSRNFRSNPDFPVPFTAQY